MAAAIGGVSEQNNARFLTKFKVTQSCEAMTWLFDCNVPPHSIIYTAPAVIVNEVML